MKVTIKRPATQIDVNNNMAYRVGEQIKAETIIPSISAFMQIFDFLVTMQAYQLHEWDVVISIKNLTNTGYPLLIVARIDELNGQLIQGSLPSSFLANLKVLFASINLQQYQFSEVFREFYREFQNINSFSN